MKRRQFLTTAGTGLAATAIASPAIAQTMPETRWRLTSSFPKSLDTIYGAAEVFAKAVAEATDNKFQIQVFAAGEIVPGLQVLDAVQNGTVQCGHTAPYYYWGKDPAFALDTAVPFGLNARQMNAWQIFGGGLELFREFYKGYGIYNMPAGNTGSQMGGWFRKEIKTPADFKGLKMRIGGFAGTVIAKMGAVPQQLAPETSTRHSRRAPSTPPMGGPYDDEKLGFTRSASTTTTPAGGRRTAARRAREPQGWASLPKEYQNIMEAACWEANTWMVAKYDARTRPRSRSWWAAARSCARSPRT